MNTIKLNWFQRILYVLGLLIIKETIKEVPRVVYTERKNNSKPIIIVTQTSLDTCHIEDLEQIDNGYILTAWETNGARKIKLKEVSSPDYNIEYLKNYKYKLKPKV